MSNEKRWLGRLADDIMALMMAVMFFTFILQIATRYLAKFQMAPGFVWTQDLTSTCMVWIVFFGGAFALKEQDHVKFDMVYNQFGPYGRRVMAIITTVCIAAFMAWSLPAVLDSWLGQLFRWNKPNPTLKIPFSGAPIPMWWIYSIYVAFSVALTIRYALRAWSLVGGATPEELDTAAAGASGR